MAHTWIKNEATGGVWACPDGVLDVYLAQGWEPADEPLEDEAHLHDPLPEAEELQDFGPESDPTDFNVGPVKAYLQTDAGALKVTQEEFDRVITAEKAGKNRKGITALADTYSEEQ